MIELKSTITCPQCGHLAFETMPTDACQYVYIRPRCSVRLTPKKGHCCIFCSYGSAPCPPIQLGSPVLMNGSGDVRANTTSTIPVRHYRRRAQ